MSTNWFDVSLDCRGSLNLPAPLKHKLGLVAGSPFFVREVDGVVILVPRNTEASQAQHEGTLDAWVNDRLHCTLPPAPLTLGATALAEAARTQRAREKHAMRMQEMQMQHALILARRGITAAPDATTQPDEAGLPQAEG